MECYHCYHESESIENETLKDLALLSPTGFVNNATCFTQMAV